jgi:glucokinase
LFSFRDFFKKELGENLVININNDANLLAYANALFGKEASKHRIVQYFTFSTGTGAGLVYDKKIFSGANDFAQEIANIPVGIEGFSYTGLKDEAIEAIGSGTGIVKYAIHLGLKVSSTEEVFKLYENKDPLAIQVISLSQKSIAKLFATTIALINPGVIVLGGPVALKNK